LKKKKLANVDITIISPKIARDFFDYLANERKIFNSRQMYKELLQRLFDYIIKQKAIRINPFAEIEIKLKTVQPPRYFQEHSLRNMRKYMLENDPQLWLASRLIFYCYIRPHEIRFMKVGDILINEGVIRIKADISKNRKERNPVIPEHFKQELVQEGILNHLEDFINSLSALRGISISATKQGMLLILRGIVQSQFIKARSLKRMFVSTGFVSLKNCHQGSILFCISQLW